MKRNAPAAIGSIDVRVTAVVPVGLAVAARGRPFGVGAGVAVDARPAADRA